MDAVLIREPNLIALLPEQAPSLIGYWRFDGNALDAGPAGNHLAPRVGSPDLAISNAIVGTAAEFYDDSLFLSNRPSLETEYLSFSVWVKSDLIPTPNSNSSQTIFKMSCATCGGDPDIDYSFSAALKNDGRVESTVGLSPPGTLAPNVWHHVAAVYGPEGGTLYVDGRLVVDDPTAKSPLQTSGGYLWIGQLWPNEAPLWNPQHLHGALDELAIWSATLSDADVLAIYANQSP